MQSFLVKYQSSIHTFISTFLVTLLGIVSLIPQDQLLSGKTWTTAFIVGIITSAVRAGIKQISPLS